MLRNGAQVSNCQNLQVKETQVPKSVAFTVKTYSVSVVALRNTLKASRQSEIAVACSDQKVRNDAGR